MLLKGIRVLDLSTLLPGPMCSLFLADLGADVIKIESINGDQMRYLGEYDKSPYFSALNRNKKGLALNLKNNEGKKIFTKLAKDADVIIEGFRPGKADALGIGYKDIKKINPHIIYCSITGYGQKGEYRDKAGHDLNYISISGLLDMASSKPFVPGIQVADNSSALVAAFSIAASLFYREKSGKGNHVDVPILHSALSMIGMHIAQLSTHDDLKTVLSGCMPCYNVYKARDGKYMSLAAIEGKFWQAFCNSVNRKDLLSGQFDSSPGMQKEMERLFESRTSDEWLESNKKYDFCCGPVNKIEEFLGDKGISRQSIMTLEGVKQVTFPAAFSSFKKLRYSKSPKLGEHTDQILSSIGYNKKAVSRLRKMGAVL